MRVHAWKSLDLAGFGTFLPIGSAIEKVQLCRERTICVCRVVSPDGYQDTEPMTADQAVKDEVEAPPLVRNRPIGTACRGLS
jgi:hypothetical protein